MLKTYQALCSAVSLLLSGLTPPQKNVRSLITSTLQMRKQRPRKVLDLIQGHRARNVFPSDLCPSKSMFLATLLPSRDSMELYYYYNSEGYPNVSITFLHSKTCTAHHFKKLWCWNGLPVVTSGGPASSSTPLQPRLLLASADCFCLIMAVRSLRKHTLPSHQSSSAQPSLIQRMLCTLLTWMGKSFKFFFFIYIKE